MKTLFQEITSLKNLFLAWEEFKKDKTNKIDVKEFKRDCKNNIFGLYKELKNKTYSHSDYYSFYVKDPKLRLINKACVKDRILHHAIFRILYHIFDKSFIYDSYSCRIGKGTHKAVDRLQYFAKKASKNNIRACFILKLDIKKFFDSIDRNILLSLIKRKVKDENAIWLIGKIIRSFSKGLPLGNITSQLFANVYLNELDWFIKHHLKEKYYIRYCDDFVILSTDRLHLENLIQKVNIFLQNNLNLSLHPNKIEIKKYHQGVDFLGYVCFPYHRVLRLKTKKRMFRNIESKRNNENFFKILESYFGVIKHCDSHKLKKKILKII
jgi:retron-type reverse transcriptase